MNEITTGQSSVPAAYRDASEESPLKAQRAFNLSMLTSGIRCVLFYVVLPFITPLLGLAPGVGPTLGISIGAVAITANVVSMRRFWRVRHRWRRPITVLHLGVIGLLLVLMALDIAELLNPAA